MLIRFIIMLMMTTELVHLMKNISLHSPHHHIRHSNSKMEHLKIQFDRSWRVDGPYFEFGDSNRTKAVARVDETAYLDCRIGLLDDKIVTWTKKSKDDPQELLTVALQLYTSNKRYKISKEYPNNWRLTIQNVVKEDEGLYKCQISTYPPKTRYVYFKVIAPSTIITNQFGIPVAQIYSTSGSFLELYCIMIEVVFPSMLRWYHNGVPLLRSNRDGGISIKTDWTRSGMESVLKIAYLTRSDAGNYTCAAQGGPPHTVNLSMLPDGGGTLYKIFSINKAARNDVQVIVIFILNIILRKRESVILSH